jgi:hypothetical protein
MQEQEQARIAIQALVDGESENPASGLGGWQGTYDELWALYQLKGGRDKVRMVVSGDRKLTTLLASHKDYTTYKEGYAEPGTAYDLAHKDIPPTRYFIDGVLRSGLALYIGNPGVGKTPALIQLGIALARGGHWMGAFPCPPCRVLYIGVEYDEAYLQELLIDSNGGPDLPANLFIHTVETFTPPVTADESIAMMDFYLNTMMMDAIIIDTFSGFLPRENFKQDKYRGDYAEFLAYHRLSLKNNALILGSWHGGKHNKDPETAYNGGQGMWGSAGGGRVTMFRDDEEEVRLRSQLRGHDRREWLLKQTRIDNARFWSVVDANPEPIMSSEIQKRIYRIVKQHSSTAEPITPSGVYAHIKSQDVMITAKENTVRQTMLRMAERGILAKSGGGYVVG